MKYGECKKYGKKSVLTKVFEFLTKETEELKVYSTIREPWEWKEWKN